MKFKLLFFLLITLTACNSTTEKKEAVAKQEPKPQQETEKKKIIFFGNSITAGYRLDPNDAFPNLIQQKIDSLGLNYECVNAGNSGETTSGGLNRLNWVLKEGCEIFVLELGANDGLRGLDLSQTEANLNQIINTVFEKVPEAKVLVCGMKVPPSMGEAYAKEYDEVFARIGQRDDISFIPFLLEGVAGIPDLNLEDGIHPTEEGHKILAETVWKRLKPML